MNEKRALVLAPRAGSAAMVASALLRHRWQVRALVHDPDRELCSDPAGLDWIKGDAMNESDVVAAAEGVSRVFDGVNLAGLARLSRPRRCPCCATPSWAAKAADARLI